MDKTCATCIDNDNGLCDRKGILTHEDDTCVLSGKLIAASVCKLKLTF